MGKRYKLTHYIQNRAAYGETHHIELGLPEHLSVSVPESPTEQERKENEDAFNEQLKVLQQENDLIVIDTAGADSHLFRVAHAAADILITPINDSLIDLDVLAKIEPETLTVKAPGHYAQTVWQARQKRAAFHKTQMQWFVLRNRVMHVSTNNEKIIWKLLEALGKRINFIPLRGLGERIIFRELFLKGLTLLDIGQPKSGVSMSMVHIAARQELRSILQAIGEEEPDSE